MAKCPDGCTCKRHSKVGNSCPTGCTCARHTAGPKRAKKISAAKKGRPLSAEHRAALKCADGCTCAKHTVRNSGQFKAGETSAFSGQRHSAETRAVLASYTGPQTSSYKHGWANTPTYRTWTSMLSRCSDPRNASYKRYGGRGIRVCGRWQGANGFVNFLADMGERPADKTLDRIDGNGNYEPDNCRWATKAEQTANRRPSR